MNRKITKTNKENIYDKYKELLEIPNLTDKDIDEIRKKVKLLAMTICEHVWGKKFY